MSENRVTEEQITAKIKDKKFTVLEDGKTTICNLYLENGFTVRGESACVDPANFDKELGEEIAYKNAKEKVWELEGYLLQENLHNTPVDFVERMEIEGKELNEKLKKAIAFLDKQRAGFVSDPENTGRNSNLAMDLLQAQTTAMATYSNILLLRVNIERSGRGLPTLADF